ncbi:MAG: 3-hydroxyacyl-CoA dehydrogenase NAD-binding domain-containing protein [Myxococcales bacterium]|nr:3-hydroxyacyl-CoA dehydrogenase NAD-binding domain-containing protein [Myxococcales bacterium]
MTVESIRVVGVLGAGQMGRGIAQVAAQSGRRVLLADADRARAQAGLERIGAELGRLVERGKMEASARDALLGRIEAVDGPGAFEAADFVVEAVSEDVDLKLRLFAQLDRTTRPGVILASNTSSISITRLAAATGRAGRVIGMHFMNPVPVMKLVEIVRALQTTDETYETTRALAVALGKATITSRDVPGFIVNRILVPLLNEACFALQEGLGSPEDIDAGARLGLNHPMGPLELADLIGLDTVLAIGEVLHRELGDDKYRPAPLLRQYVAAGWLGRKSGRGFYVYANR